MIRWSISLVGTIAVLGCFAAAQNSPSRMFSSDLIAWSGVLQPTSPEQQPQRQQPTPDPNPQSQPTPTPNAQSPADPGSTETSTSPAQTFTGTISKEGESFTLKVSDTSSYKLDNQAQVQQYVGLRVRVTGTLDPASNLIHVEQVEPLS